MTQPPPDPTPVPPDDSDLDATNDLVALRHEAAGRRRELRETQAARDALQGRVTNLERREVERVAAQHLRDPRDFLTLLGDDLTALRDDGGELDPARVEARIEDVLADGREHWRKAPVEEPTTVDLHNGVRQTHTEPERPSFGLALRGRR